jgi:hypothetical protein
VRAQEAIIPLEHIVPSPAVLARWDRLEADIRAGANFGFTAFSEVGQGIFRKYCN